MKSIRFLSLFCTLALFLPPPPFPSLPSSSSSSSFPPPPPPLARIPSPPPSTTFNPVPSCTTGAFRFASRARAAAAAAIFSFVVRGFLDLFFLLDAGCDPFASALSLASAACSWGGGRIWVLRFFDVVGGAVGGDDDDDDDAVVSGVLVGGLSIAASSWAAFAMRPEVVRVLNLGLGLGFGFGLTGMLARAGSGRGGEMVVFESWTVLLPGHGDCDQGDVDGGVD